MEKKASSSVAGLVLLCLAAAVHATESPEYKVVRSEPGFEVRLCGESSWMSSSVDGITFREATYLVFHGFLLLILVHVI
ncbi:hypothetical protein MLD38_036647 [Melastoma candidum]|uniref:Uncharacterized protein n=1 Tax=Melastoma candidum TaxID=119954 RepID=A0ACB9LM74_9MYRT|nr:hypothetical protein MLD38_036647 [Melastoma candidum]